jgi:hypothetical protein
MNDLVLVDVSEGDYLSSDALSSHRDYTQQTIRSQLSDVSNENSGCIENITNVGDDVDWYGNCVLHHLFAPNDVDVNLVCQVMEKQPHLLSLRNQFGRIPLHYAVDRIRTNEKCIRLYIALFPRAGHIYDNDGITPLNLAVKWEHSRVVRRLLQDGNQWGALNAFSVVALAIKKSFRRSPSSLHVLPEEADSNNSDLSDNKDLLSVDNKRK